MAHLCIIKEKLSYLSLLKHPIVIDILFLLCYYSSLHLSSARSIRCFFSGSDASILHFYSLLESYILASGFKRISIGVLLIAVGIIIDSVQSYLLQSPLLSDNQTLTVGIILSKDILFILGTFIIVIGTKSTGDKLESLTK
jgi:hypothetical protein